MVSKSVWNLPGGPWERIFAGVWHRFNVAVYENKDKVLLTTIFPKAGDVSWIMIRVDRILMVADGFERLEKKLEDMHLHVLKQRAPGGHMVYLMLLSPPTTVDFGSKEIGSRVFQQVLGLEEQAERIRSAAKGAGVEVMDLKDAPYKESASLLGNPTLLLSMLSVAPEGEEPKREKLREIVLGEEGGKLFKVDESVFSGFTSIKKGSEEERNYLAQAMMEDAMVDVGPLPLILDFGGHPLKLGQPNPYPYDYSTYGFEGNASFRVKEYDLADDECEIRINLDHASANFVWKLFGLGQDEASTLILEAVERLQGATGIRDVEGIMREVIKTPVYNEKDKATLGRATRMLRAVSRAYGPIFSNERDIRETVAGWVKNNERVYLSMSRLDQKRRLAFTLFMLETIQGLKGSDILSDIEERRLDYIFPCMLDMSWFGRGVMQAEIVGKLVGERGKGLFVTEDELPMEIESRVSYRFHILAPRRAKLFLGGRGAEFNVRPLLSCPP